MSFKEELEKRYQVKAAGKWEPDTEDLYDYANNVEPLYNQLMKAKSHSAALRVAEAIIEEYNEANKKFPERLYKGDAQELADYIMSQLED